MNSIFNDKNFGDCISQHTDIIIYIKDVENGPCEVGHELDYDVIIKNKSKKNISFLRIDKCVYTDTDRLGRKCDLSVNDDVEVYFIEIKSIIKRNFGKELKTNSKKDDALDQLIQTICKFKIRFPNLKPANVKAVIALKPNVNIYSQPIQSSEQARINELLTSCGTPFLYIGNEIKFNK